MSYFYDFNKNKVITREGINIQYGKAGRARGTDRLAELNIYPILEPSLPDGMQVAKKLAPTDTDSGPVYILDEGYAKRVINVQYCDEDCLFDDLIKQVQRLQTKALVAGEITIHDELDSLSLLLENHGVLTKEQLRTRVASTLTSLQYQSGFDSIDEDAEISRMNTNLATYETIDDINPNYVIPNNIRADLYGV